MSTIAENLLAVKQNIEAARLRGRHSAATVQLLAVSKTFPVADIRQALAAGQLCFGENRVQELEEKYQELPEASWHLIGHLQLNKVRHLVDKTALIHSLDSLELAEEIEKRYAAADATARVLVQLNLAEEATKSGLAAAELADFLDALADFPHLRTEGLMTIGPHVEALEEIRPVFAQLRQLRDREQTRPRPHCQLCHLSMGMSHDYTVAVEEGADLVRVGSAIFGQRSYEIDTSCQ